jgi:uncharacterized membrane protein YeaQ/YmgE (transglycosylase-associated protein family)
MRPANGSVGPRAGCGELRAAAAAGQGRRIGDDDAFDLGGILSAIIGVVIVLLVVGFVARRMTPGQDAPS